MFTQMRKYHKAFLIGVTVIIAASFGMTSAIFGLFDEASNTVAGSFADGNVEVNKQAFSIAHSRWQIYFEFVKILSPKAEKIKSIKDQESLRQNAQLFRMRHPTWDAIYSLRESVARLDQKFDEQLGQPDVWNRLLQGQVSLFQLEAEFYTKISPKEREQASRRLTHQEAWNFFMLLHQAQEWGIVVTDEEVQIFLAETAKSFPGGDDALQQRIRNANLLPTTFQTTTKEFLTILKYINARTINTKISNEVVQKQHAQFNTQYSFQWFTLPAQTYLAAVTNDYAKEQQEFYDEMTQNNPEYFKIPAVADIEYLATSGQDCMDKVQITDVEVELQFQLQYPNFDETDPEALANMAKDKQKLKDDLRIQRANQTAEQLIREIHSKIGNLGNMASFDLVGTTYKLEYKNLSNISQEQFLKNETNPPSEAENLVYKKMTAGEISPVLASRPSFDPYSYQVKQNVSKKFYIFRLNRREEAKLPSRDEVLQNELLFLSRYYANNQAKFQNMNRYRLAYVVLNFNYIHNNLVITSKIKNDFYDKYKDQLYRAGDKHRPLQEVDNDVEYRAQNLTAIQELHKLNDIHRVCKEKGADLQLDPVIRELKHQMLLVPQALSYKEDTEFYTADEIVRNNPANDLEFEAPQENTTLSDVKDCATGKYFYKVIEVDQGQNKEFAQIKEQVKTDFLKLRALHRCEFALKQWAEVYQRQKFETVQLLEQHYQAKISSNPNLNSLTAEKQNRLQTLNTKLFQTLALQRGASFQQSPLTSKDQLLEVKAFRDIGMQLLTPIFALQPGEISTPISVEKNGEVAIFQMLETRMPNIPEISSLETNYIRELLWQRTYRSQLVGLVSHESLAHELNFKDEGHFMDKELDEEFFEETPSTLPKDIMPSSLPFEDEPVE